MTLNQPSEKHTWLNEITKLKELIKRVIHFEPYGRTTLNVMLLLLMTHMMNSITFIIYSRQRFRYVQQNEGNGWQLLDNARSLYSDCHKCDFVNRYLRDTKMKYNIECFHSTCYYATKYTFSRKTLKTMLTLHNAR